MWVPSTLSGLNPKIFFPTKARSDSEKISYVFSKENFSYISGNGTLNFLASAPKIFSTKFLIFFPKNPALKKFLLFSQKELLILWKRKPRKNPYITRNRTFLFFRRWNFLILPETELSYTFGNETFLYFWRRNFFILPERNFLIFRERHIQNPGIFRTRDIFRILPNIYD